MPTAAQKNTQSDMTAALNSAAAAISLAAQSHETYAKLAAEKTQADVTIAIMRNDIQYIKSDVSEIKDSLKTIKDDFVTHVEFAESLKNLEEQMKPMKNILYGLIAAIVLAVIGGVLDLVIK